jgi:hypothetical protein
MGIYINGPWKENKNVDLDTRPSEVRRCSEYIILKYCYIIMHKSTDKTTIEVSCAVCRRSAGVKCGGSETLLFRTTIN